MQTIMSNISTSQIRSISSLPRDYVKLAREAETTGEVVFLKHNTPYVVLVDFDRWQQLKEKEALYDTQRAIESVEQSEREYASGKAKKLRSLQNL